MQCLSAPDLLDAFGLSNASELTVDQLQLICPAVLTQVLLPSCPYMTPSTITTDPQGESKTSLILRFPGRTSFFIPLPHISTCIFALYFPLEDYYMGECGHFVHFYG